MHSLRQRLHGLLGGTSGGHHEPGDARLVQFADEIIQRGGRDRALARDLFHIFGAQVSDYEFMTTADQATRHVSAHPAQTDHSQTHKSSLPTNIKSFL